MKDSLQRPNLAQESAAFLQNILQSRPRRKQPLALPCLSFRTVVDEVIYKEFGSSILFIDVAGLGRGSIL